MKPKDNPAQLELFQELQNEVRTRRKRTALSRPLEVKLKQSYVINIPYENIIVAGIGMFFLIILSFCLGVRRAETIFSSAASGLGESRSTAPSIQDLSVQQTSLVQPEPARIDQGQINLNQTGPEKAKPEMPASGVLSGEKKYTIQLITYSRQPEAGREVNRLKAAGQDAFFFVDGRFYKVCSGAYTDTAQAKGHLARFRKNRWYKDCFLRKYPKDKVFLEARKE